MESLNEIINPYITEIVLLTFVFAFFAIIISFINFHRTSKTMKKYKKMMRGMENKNLEFLLESHLDIVEKVNLRVNDLDKDVKEIAENLTNCVQKVGIVRYNPFDQMGGDQSFSLAMLDESGNGVVLSGLYSREGSAVFAKPILNNKSRYPLSEEEIKAIDIAQNS